MAKHTFLSGHQARGDACAFKRDKWLHQPRIIWPTVQWIKWPASLDGNGKALLRHILTWMHGCLCKAHSFFSLFLSHILLYLLSLSLSLAWSSTDTRVKSDLSSHLMPMPAIVSFTFILSHTHTHTVFSHFTFCHCQVNHQGQFKSIVVCVWVWVWVSVCRVLTFGVQHD